MANTDDTQSLQDQADQTEEDLARIRGAIENRFLRRSLARANRALGWMAIAACVVLIVVEVVTVDEGAFRDG